MFCIEEHPVHGQLRMDLGRHADGMLDARQEWTTTIGADEKDQTFSMLDLWHGRVMYVHSGSEDKNDFFMFSVFSSNKKELPLSLKSNRLHRFDISISPVNDAPVLSLPEGNLFTLLEKSKQQVGKAGESEAEYKNDLYNICLSLRLTKLDLLYIYMSYISGINISSMSLANTRCAQSVRP